MYKHIILAYDGSITGQKALLELEELAHWGQPRLTLVAVAPNPLDVGSMEMGYYASANQGPLEETLAAQLAQGVQTLKAMGYTVQGEVLKGEVIRELSGFAERVGADLIVVGSHGHTGLTRLMLGSVATKVVAESTVPVLVAR